MKTTRRNPQKKHAKFEVKKKHPKSKQTSDLGGSRALFGWGLGGSGTYFGSSRAILGRFWDAQNRPCFKHGSKMGSKKPYGMILGRFCDGVLNILRGAGKGFGRIEMLFFEL